MKIIKGWILCFSLITCSVFGWAQASMPFRHLSKKDGLSQASVFAIAQDKEGFMWFGTREGLNRFDGYRFKVYKNEDTPNSIVSNDIRTLFFDSLKNELWIGSYSGLSKYRPTTDDFLNFRHFPSTNSGLSDNRIRRIFRDTKGRLWVGTADGLNLLDEEKNTFKVYYFEDTNVNAIPSNDVKAIYEDESGKIWFGTAEGLYFLSENTKDYTFERIDKKVERQFSDIHLKSVLGDSEGNLWIGTYDGGVNYWNTKNDSVTVYLNKNNQPDVLNHNNIRSLCIDENDNLWVGTFEGLNFLKKGTKTFKKFKKVEFGNQGLSDNSIRSLFLDKRGSLWVGTYYGGINYSDESDNNFTNFRHSPVGNSLSGDVVSSFVEDKKGNLWIGTEGAGLNFYDSKKSKFTNYKALPSTKNSLSGNNVKQLLLDENQLWIGTFQAGLNLFDIPTNRFYHFRNEPDNPNSLSSNNVYGLHKEGNKLWILTYDGGLDILDLDSKKFYNYKNIPGQDNSLSSIYTRVILETTDSQLWIGTDNGLNKVIKAASGLPESFETFFPDEKIYSLQKDTKGNIWVGTFTNGLYCFNPEDNSHLHYSIADGLPGNIIYGILEVDSNEIWISTNNGLSKFNPQQKKFTNYNYSNGLRNSEYNFNAYYKTREGDLLFGGINGFTRFNPSLIQANLFVPPVVFTELRKNNRVINVGDEDGLLDKSIDKTETIVFNHKEANFSIGFAALDYLSPESNRYAFMLDGIDQDWNYSTGKTEATYTIQKEGDYIFRVKGGNSEGIWNPEERNIKIKVLPPPWRSVWAYLMYLLLGGILIFVLVRFISLRQKLKFEQIAKHQLQELNEVKLRFFTDITHEFRTPLTLILGPLKDLITTEEHSEPVKQQLSLIEKNAQRLLNLVNQILTFRKLGTNHNPLQIVHDNIIDFLKEVFLSFQESANLRNIDYQFISEKTSTAVWFDQDKLEKVFYNLLSNAFKFTPDSGQISMSILDTEDFVEVRVKDNGVGIEPAYRDQIFKRFYEKSNQQPSIIKGTGIGLAISKQMVELHKGKIFVENTDSEQWSGGATFVIQIPKGRAHFDQDVVILETKKVISSTSVFMPKNSPIIVSMPEKKPLPADAPKLLIVEDNPEVRAYIQRIFVRKYKIVTAENGKEGLKKVKTETPDLIISDVMMPEMDGITFCNKLKTTVETSHIPIILLTARTAAMFKIDGLKNGADDYVTKPFNSEELKLRVGNIIKARQEAKDKFARVISFDPKEITVTSADEIFLEQTLQVIEEEIDSYEFNVNQLAERVAVSRPLLFTKLKALTGQTPNNFIKSIRLKRAAQLLKTQKLNISEVAYRVGFKDPKYFRKCFKEQFKLSPSNFMKKVE